MFDAETTSKLHVMSVILDEIKSVLVWHKMFYKHISRSLGPVFTAVEFRRELSLAELRCLVLRRQGNFVGQATHCNALYDIKTDLI